MAGHSGKAFYDDDPQNAVLADEMGVVIGTSHHEPMARFMWNGVDTEKENGIIRRIKKP